MGATQGIKASILHTWYEVYRLAFSTLADLTGTTTDTGTMTIGTAEKAATWTLRNSSGYLDSLNIASGKLVWDMSAVSSTTSLQTAATGPMLRTLMKNLWGPIGTGGAPYSTTPYCPMRLACAVDGSFQGDQNTELVGMGFGLGAGTTGHGFMMETGFSGGSAKTLWQSYAPSKQGTSIAGTNTALCLSIHTSKAIPYTATATGGGEPPELAVMRTADWTARTAMYLDAYPASASLGVDFQSPTSTAGHFILHASTGNTNNNFTPKHTGIAVAIPRRFLLV
jgi:hypothetical protein